MSLAKRGPEDPVYRHHQIRPTTTLIRSLVEIEIDELREAARWHRRMLVSLLLAASSIAVPTASVPLFILSAWSAARLAGTLQGDQIRFLPLLFGLVPGLSLVQAVLLDLRLRRAFGRRSVKMRFFATELALAQAEAAVRRRRSVPRTKPGPRALVTRAPWELAPDEEETQLIDLTDRRAA